MNRSIDDYLAQPYRVQLTPAGPDDGGGWVASIPDLPGCMAHGDSQVEALNLLEDAKRAWIETALEAGRTIPEPTADEEEDYSGRFTLRLPRTLHRQLAEAARGERLSLNQYILSLLSRNFGFETAHKFLR